MSTKIATGIVNSSGATRSHNESNLLLRTSTGVLYAIVPSSVAHPLQLYKSTNNGLSWSITPDYEKAPPLAAVNSNNIVAAAVDNNDNLNIVYSQAQGTQKYILYNTSTDTFGSPLGVPSTALPITLSIAVDTNRIVHIVAAAGGSAGQYFNNARGIFNPTPISLGSDTGISDAEIIIDQNNVPQVAVSDTNNGLVAYLGNKNIATSFTRTQIATTSLITTAATYSGIGITLDSNSNTWIAFSAANNGPIMLVQHIKTNSWATWNTSISDDFAGKQPSTVTDGTDIYIFYERNAGGLAYDKYDSVNQLWLGEQIIQANTSALTTDKQYHNSLVKWSNYFDNGFTGANNANQNIIEYLFDDGTSVYYDKVNTGQISTGLAQISFSAPGASFTTSTSSTSSSTSTSISTSTSSTSTSTSISTSSTSTSTSISTSSTSSSTSISTSSTSSSTSMSTSSTSQSTSTSISTSSTSTSTTQSFTTSTSSTSSSISTSSTSTSLSTSTSSTSTSTSHSTSSTSTSISTSSTSTSASTSLSTSSTSTSLSTTTSISTSSTSTSTTVSFTTSTSSTSSSTSISTSSTSTSTSLSTSSTSTSISTSTSSTSTSTTTSHSTSTSSTSQSTSTSISTSSTSTSTSFSTSSTSTSISHSTSTSSTSTSTSLSTSTSSTSTSMSTTMSFSTSSTSTSVSTSSTSTSTTTIPGVDFGFKPRATINRVNYVTNIDSRRPIPANIRRRFD